MPRRKIADIVVVVTLVVVVLTNQTFGQGEYSNWIFGTGAQIKWSGTTPAFIPSPNESLFMAMEGTSAISDKNGKLLFSTDGFYVRQWDGVHLQPNPTFGNDAHATQSSLIVPAGCVKEGSGQNWLKYFIFTTSDVVRSQVQNGIMHFDNLTPASSTKLQVTEVSVLARPTCPKECDVAFKPDGRTPANIIVGKPKTLQTRVSEKLTATRKVGFPGVTGYWVVAHSFDHRNTATAAENSTFYVYDVSNGTVSQTGTFVEGSPHKVSLTTDNPRNAGIGQMKIAPRGADVANTTIALAVHQGFVELLSFNRITGVIGPAFRKYDQTSDPAKISNRYFYGLEFSPDGRFVYVTTQGGANAVPGPGKLLRMTVGGASAVDAIAVSTNNQPYDFSQMQLGPDDKIYIARSRANTTTPTGGSVDVINAPNSTAVSGILYSAGLFNGVTNGIALGLPNVIYY